MEIANYNVVLSTLTYDHGFGAVGVGALTVSNGATFTQAAGGWRSRAS